MASYVPRRRCESNRDRKIEKESIGASSPSSRARQRTAILPATFGGDGLKTENEKEQGNGSGSFFTSTWSSATGRGQLREPLARLRRLHSKLGKIQNERQS